MRYQVTYQAIFNDSMIRKGGFIEVEAINEVSAQVKAIVELEKKYPTAKIIANGVYKLNN